MGERLAGMLDIGVGHRRVFTHDVHALDLVAMDRVHDLDHGQPWLFIELGLPQCLEFLPDVGVRDRLVVGKDHRDQTGVGGALHVVLAAQWMKAGARPAHLPGHHRQRDQAARIVGAMNVLRNAHAPKDDRPLGAGICAGDVTQGRGADAADVSHLLRRIVADVLAQLFVILGVRLDVLAVGQPLLDDRVEQRVQQRHVAPRVKAQGRGRVPHQGVAARVHDEHLGAALGRLFEERGGDRMVLCRPRADDDDDVGIQCRRERCGDRAGPGPLHQGGD